MAETESPRERYRAQVRAEIKQQAWKQIADAGVPSLSLNAIAKQVGMTGPALYRYFASRDELITALIRDAYRSLADTVRAAYDSGADLAKLAHTMRDWARHDPQRYFLIYGTPVPGYHAPDDITAISHEVMTVLLESVRALPVDGPRTPFDEHLENHRDWARGHPATTSQLHRALSFWTRLHGVISLDLAGHFTGMKFDPDLLIDDELAELLPDRAGTGPVRMTYDAVFIQHSTFYVTDEAGWAETPTPVDGLAVVPGGIGVLSEADGIRPVRLEFWGEPPGEADAEFETSTGRVRLLNGLQEPSQHDKQFDLDGPGAYGFTVDGADEGFVLRWWKI